MHSAYVIFILLQQTRTHFWHFGLYLAFLYAAVHNLKTKKFRHHSHTMGYVCANFRISTGFGFSGSVEKNVLIFCIFGLFWRFVLQILPQLKNFPKI